MRISIWQQFSSNHSASFTVVGKFQTGEDAQAAADKLNQIMQSIGTWWRDNKSAEWIQRVDSDQLTPAEQNLRTTYGVDWPQSMVRDYFKWNRELPIHAVKQFVFVESGQATLGPRPFNQLMEQFGGEVAVEFSESLGKPEIYPVTALTGILVFSMPDDSTAQAIERAWRQFLSASDYPKIPPWLVYHDGKLDFQAEKLLAMTQLYFSQLHNARFYRQIIAAETDHDTRLLNELMLQFFERYKQGQIKLTIAEFRWVSEILENTSGVIHKKAIIERMGSKCRINGLFFLEYAGPVAAIIAWLEDHGCTDIDFTFVQDPPPPDGKFKS